MDAVGRRRLRRPILILAAVAGAVLLVRLSGLDGLARLDRLARFKAWIEGFGPWAPLVYVAGYVVAELLFVPALPLTLLGGIAFGPVRGTLYVWVAATLAAAAAFLAARYALRGAVERWLAGSPRLARLDAAVAEHGWRILMVTRLVPLFPFNLQNFAYGLTRIRFGTYVLVSSLAMLPGTAAYTVAAGALTEGGQDPRRMLALLGAAGVLVVLLSLLPRWLTRRSRAATAALGPAP